MRARYRSRQNLEPYCASRTLIGPARFRDFRLRHLFLGGFQNVSHGWHPEITLGAHNSEGSWLPIPGSSRCVDDLQAIFNPDASHDPVDVVLYRLLGKVQGGRDFLICKSLTYKRNNL